MKLLILFSHNFYKESLPYRLGNIMALAKDTPSEQAKPPINLETITGEGFDIIASLHAMDPRRPIEQVAVMHLPPGQMLGFYHEFVQLYVRYDLAVEGKYWKAEESACSHIAAALRDASPDTVNTWMTLVPELHRYSGHTLQHH